MQNQLSLKCANGCKTWKWRFHSNIFLGLEAYQSTIMKYASNFEKTNFIIKKALLKNGNYGKMKMMKQWFVLLEKQKLFYPIGKDGTLGYFELKEEDTNKPKVSFLNLSKRTVLAMETMNTGFFMIP